MASECRPCFVWVLVVHEWRFQWWLNRCGMHAYYDNRNLRNQRGSQRRQRWGVFFYVLISFLFAAFLIAFFIAFRFAFLLLFYCVLICFSICFSICFCVLENRRGNRMHCAGKSLCVLRAWCVLCLACMLCAVSCVHVVCCVVLRACSMYLRCLHVSLGHI